MANAFDVGCRKRVGAGWDQSVQVLEFYMKQGADAWLTGSGAGRIMLRAADLGHARE